MDMNIKLSKDNLLLTACTAAGNGKGPVLAENAVRVMYNLNETYLEYQYVKTDKNEGMKNFLEDNQEFITAEQINLLRGSPAKSGPVHFAYKKTFSFILCTLREFGTQVTNLLFFLADDLFLLRYRLDLVKPIGLFYREN